MNSTASWEGAAQTRYGDAAAAWRAGFADGIKPVTVLTVSEWADQYRILTGKEGNEPGQWKTARTPYLREIMDCLSATHPATDVVFKKPSQIGGTECGHNWIGYIIAQAPGVVMYVLPSSETSARTSKQRLAAMIDECPAIRARIAPARSRDSGNTTRMKDFPGGTLLLASSKSAAELKSVPVQYLYADEIDEYPDDLDGQGDALKLAERRTGGRSRTKKFKTSTPTVKGRSRIDREFEKSDQRHYYVPCPHCAHEQRLVWDQVRYEVALEHEYTCRHCGTVSDAAGVEPGPHACPDCGAAGQADEHSLTSRATHDILDVWYECTACNARIDESAKPAMLTAGRWVAHSPGPRRACGFALSALYAPLGWYSWRQAVTEYLESEGKPNLRKVWTNTVLGESYEDSFEQPDEVALKLRADTDYLIRTVPAGGLLLTAGVDVQGDRLEVKVKAWGRDEESWLIDYQVLHGDPVQLDGEATVWAQLDELLSRRWPHASGAVLGITATAVDTGGHCTHTVYEYCRRRAARHVIAVKGSSLRGRPILGKPTMVDVNYRGRTVEHGVKLWPVGTDTAKEQIYRRLNITEPGPGAMHWPMGLPDTYFKGLTAEKLKRQTNRRGYEVVVWEKEGTQRNEPLDCEVYAYVAALYAAVPRMNWDGLERAILRQVQVDDDAPVVSPVTAPVQAAPTQPSAPRPRPRSRGFVSRWQ